jgi:hypothetical protein
MSTENQKEIYQYSLSKKYIATFQTLDEASTSTNVKKMSIMHCLNKLTMTAGKYIWSYTELTKNDIIREVYQYSLDGQYIATFKNIDEASNTLNIYKAAIGNCLSKMTKSAGNFAWYDTKLDTLEKKIENEVKNEDEEKIEVPKLDIQPLKRKETKKTIYCYDLKGKLLYEFLGLEEASEKTGVDKKAISVCCLGKDNRKKTGDYQFRYEKLNNEDIPEYVRNKGDTAKKVFEFDLNGKVIESFDSIREASKLTNTDRSALSKCILKKGLTAGKHKWSETEEYDFEEEKQRVEVTAINKQEKTKATVLERYNVNHVSQLEEVEEKRKATVFKRYGVEHPSQNSEIQEKIKATNLERYDVKFVFQSTEFKEQLKAANLKRFGVEYVFQTEEFKEKRKATNLEKYKVENPMQLEEVKEQIKNTNVQKYKVEYVFQSEEFKEKRKATLLERYGVEHPSQNIEIFNKQQKSGYKNKEVKTPKGKTIYLQGYEPYAYPKLLEKYDEDEIINDRRLIPTFWWTDNNNVKHVYFADFFIPKDKLIVEIKSTWTYELNKVKIEKTKEVIESSGYKYECWVLNYKKKIVLKI